jgi:hypothetical protein
VVVISGMAVFKPTGNSGAGEGVSVGETVAIGEMEGSVEVGKAICVAACVGTTSGGCAQAARIRTTKDKVREECFIVFSTACCFVNYMAWRVDKTLHIFEEHNPLSCFNILDYSYLLCEKCHLTSPYKSVMLYSANVQRCTNTVHFGRLEVRECWSM